MRWQRRFSERSTRATSTVSWRWPPRTSNSPRSSPSAFADVRWEVLEVRAYGGAGVAHVRMAGTLGGVPVNLMMWLAARLREHRVSWWSFFRTEREAIEAVMRE